VKRADKRIDFSLPHAKMAMEDKGISKERVVRAIREPSRTRRMKTPRRLRFEQDQSSGRRLVVIVEESASSLLVITTWVMQ